MVVAIVALSLYTLKYYPTFDVCINTQLKELYLLPHMMPLRACSHQTDIPNLPRWRDPMDNSIEMLHWNRL